MRQSQLVQVLNFSRFFAKFMVVAGGENSKELLLCVCETTACDESSYIGTRRMASADGISKLRVTWTENEAINETVCTVHRNTGNEASLILGKVYRVVPDTRAAKDDLVRVIDESGEDYLFDKDQFVLVDFPPAVRKKILAIQHAS